MLLMVSIRRQLLFALIFSSSVLFANGISYSVEFEGLDDPRTLKALKSNSQLIALRKKPPSSINALRFRAESDMPELVRILHAHGYLEAEIDMRIKEDLRDYSVIVQIKPGPLYLIEKYKIDLKNETGIDCPKPSLSELGITLGTPADTKQILDSELCALQLLSEAGFPLAVIEKREIIADGKTKRVKIFLTIDTGPLAYFGETTIEGNCSVRSLLIEQQIQWCEGERYNSCLVEGTQQALMDLGLFSSVYITHPKSLSEIEQMPMKIEVCETKHKTISLGASYQTTFGAGATFGWENRNVGGLGRTATLQADIAQKSHTGIASYMIPNFYCIGQDFTVQAQAAFEKITPYEMQSYSVLSRFDRREGKYFFFSIGPKVEYMLVTDSVDNGNFLLVEVPIFVRWTNVEDFLNPTSGFRLEYRGVPAVNIKDISDFYYSQVFTLSSYIPLWQNEFLILAQKLTLGTIFSNGIGATPVPKRFFGGSEDNLRGYKYFTVSPLDEDDQPIGGRSAIYYSLEPRFRLSKHFGLVPFLDVGNVYETQLPTFRGKWRKSTGIGLRYYSFLGPLRLDVAFPLDRRKGIDPTWWVFVSLGQTF